MQPNLLNSITVEIKQVDQDKTVYSNRRREPINRVKRYSSFKIKAQIFFGDSEFLESAQGSSPDDRNLAGNILNAKGYIVVRKKDLLKKEKELKVGDKISSYGNTGYEKPCEYYLIGHKDAAHYSDVGQCTLEKWYFEDRK